LHRFGDIAGFCAHDPPHPYSTLIFGVFPLLDQIAHVGVSPCIYPKLFGREIIFEVFQHVITVSPVKSSQVAFNIGQWQTHNL